MTAHEFARLLLKGPDIMLTYPVLNGVSEVEKVNKTMVRTDLMGPAYPMDRKIEVLVID